MLMVGRMEAEKDTVDTHIQHKTKQYRLFKLEDDAGYKPNPAIPSIRHQ